jgi:acetyl-CoA C-acetyltransferase
MPLHRLAWPWPKPSSSPPPAPPAGRNGGRLSGWHPADLARRCSNALVDRTGIDPAAGRGRDHGLRGQVGEQSTTWRATPCWPASCRIVPGTSVDRQCGSSQQALHFAAQAVMSGTMDCVIAAGVESMTRVPMGTAVALPRKAAWAPT